MTPDDAKSQTNFSFSVYPVSEIHKQPFFLQLHSMVNASFDVAGYKPQNWELGPQPKVFKRLDPDPTRGAALLEEELGEFGFVAVAFAPGGGGDGPEGQNDTLSDKIPAASIGVLPFSGKPKFVEENVIQPGVEWELTCVAVSPDWRGHGLVMKLVEEIVQYVRLKQGCIGQRIRIVVLTIEELNGAYWRKLGWETLQENGWITIPRLTVINRIPGIYIPTSDPLLLWYGERWYGGGERNDA
ncbi:hypothetical protein K435DRAFT_963026 [Dendrothele bispora CBS 962.96]|uniref:N-acetyltransferase domain-containing protein n=1 Tax=Dendrothele bispora (strain CBS 962.96) TaxID=1314807 RepID=A0A4S8MIU6_DENBC|nr:hypothetical protein K435DRAFT_963026 [Dendrothele bispora CBS 962.96]